MLHRLPRKRGNNYGVIVQSYADFAIHNYVLATVVFDGYGGGPSIKDNTHPRSGQNIHPIVRFTAETDYSGRTYENLSRDYNKHGLINLTRDELNKKDCNVINAPPGCR